MERGAYLVNTIMSCQNCHTPMGPNGPQFDRALSGGLRFDEPVFDVVASNITPDPETGIGKWSTEDIKRLLTTGIRPNGVSVAPVMPTAFYKVIPPADLDAIAAYLKSVKPVSNQVPAPVYKVALGREDVPGASAPLPASDLGDPVKRGFYLATIGHCMECHTPMVKGAHDFSQLGKGGREFPGPWGVSTSRNITSSKTAGLGNWSDADIKRAITQGLHVDGTKLKPPMGYPFYARMTDGDLNDLVAWLRTVPAKD